MGTYASELRRRSFLAFLSRGRAGALVAIGAIFSAGALTGVVFSPQQPDTPGTTGGTTTTLPPGNSVVLTNDTWRCTNYPQPINFALVKVTVDSTHLVTPAVQIDSGCSGTIDRVEIDNENGDGIHIGAFAHDVTIRGGYVHSPVGGCSMCGIIHVDGIQALGGQRITLENLDINYQTASNAALFIAQGAAQLEVPTDVICDGCTIQRSPEDNRTVRVYTSLRSGVRNSTIYWCGTGVGCGQGNAFVTDSTTQAVVNENNTFLLTGFGG